MKRYIQRGRFRTDNEKKGLDSILRFDYMGSAEFEFGALNKSWTRIKEKRVDYVLTHFIINKKKITVYCKAEQVIEMEAFLKGLSMNKVRLKDATSFDRYINGQTEYDPCDFWWDIENDFMFWRYDDKFKHEFLNLLQPESKETLLSKFKKLFKWF